MTSLAGIIIFGTEINMLGGIGLVLNLVGGAWYSAVRFSRPSTVRTEDVESKTEDSETVPIDTVVSSPHVVERHHCKEVPE